MTPAGAASEAGSLRIEPVAPDSPAASALIALGDAYAASLYPQESNHMESVDALKSPNVCFLGCYLGDVLVGTGAVKVLDDDGSYGEIKRVFVQETHRGRGISKAIMQHLEARLLSRRIHVARLETGIHQAEALGLYERLGYVRRGPFGAYAHDPLSVFMEKKLAP